MDARSLQVANQTDEQRRLPKPGGRKHTGLGQYALDQRAPGPGEGKIRPHNLAHDLKLGASTRKSSFAAAELPTRDEWPPREVGRASGVRNGRIPIC